MAIDPFVRLLTDQSKIVVESATYAFIKFNEFYPSIFLHSVIDNLLRLTTIPTSIRC
jgi:hypothetical protein